MVLARNCRPKRFSEVVGHDSFVKLIQTALQKNLLNAPSVFYGQAGVGKTTFARLIALWFACEQRTSDVCGVCAGCISVINNSHPDVVEVDGATETSIDSMRALLETVVYKPFRAEKRVYIIDEVHMLSKHAISAMLKALEEPPEHVQFVLATTEIDKIPKTLLSRCFKVFLSSIDNTSIKKYVLSLIEQRKGSIDEVSLKILLNYANGSMRQALSILDQLLILCNGNINANTTKEFLGFVTDETLSDIISAALNKDMKKLLPLIDMNNYNLQPIIFFQMLLQQIKRHVIADPSDRLIKIGYNMAEGMLILHNTPYPYDVLPLIILRSFCCDVESSHTEYTKEKSTMSSESLLQKTDTNIIEENGLQTSKAIDTNSQSLHDFASELFSAKK